MRRRELIAVGLLLGAGAPTNPASASVPDELKIVPNVSSLGAATAAQVVLCLGYHHAGDGGGGVFAWKPDSDAEPDLGLVFRSDLSATGRWMRIQNGEINPKWFGAYGDGVHDDTEAFVRCFGKCSQASLSGKWTSIEVPSGVYLLNGPVSAKFNRVQVVGKFAVLRQTRRNCPILEIEGAEWTLSGLRFEWNELQGSESTESVAIAMVGGGCWGFRVESCHFNGGFRGISSYLNTMFNNPLVWAASIVDCRFRNFAGAAIFIQPRRTNAGQLSLTLQDIGVYHYRAPAVEPHIRIWDCEVFLSQLDIEGFALEDISLEQCYGSILSVHIEHKKATLPEAKEVCVLRASRSSLFCQGWTVQGALTSTVGRCTYRIINAFESNIVVAHIIDKSFGFVGDWDRVSLGGKNTSYNLLTALPLRTNQKVMSGYRVEASYGNNFYDAMPAFLLDPDADEFEIPRASKAEVIYSIELTRHKHLALPHPAACSGAVCRIMRADTSSGSGVIFVHGSDQRQWKLQSAGSWLEFIWSNDLKKWLRAAGS
ncbi:hypothetical protein IVB57_07455 [Bradyrhizobium sp. CW9]|uniref:hypothetical protein n=1 Tax=Bradyrhizobium sp. CW9 TaxID=2782689 RepID=UPI001FFA9D4E|nr:hypothetical protein [Bradyrhizobium sp. CW9]MCK1328230.1 hypothetical protein [Bradyrhizobium sp. CW9]